MGTLFNQDVRIRSDIDTRKFESEIDYLSNLSDEHNIPFSELVALKHACEIERQNNLYVNNGDIHDEQMTGIGELLKELIQVLSSEK